MDLQLRADWCSHFEAFYQYRGNVEGNVPAKSRRGTRPNRSAPVPASGPGGRSKGKGLGGARIVSPDADPPTRARRHAKADARSLGLCGRAAVRGRRPRPRQVERAAHGSIARTAAVQSSRVAAKGAAAARSKRCCAGDPGEVQLAWAAPHASAPVSPRWPVLRLAPV